MSPQYSFALKEEKSKTLPVISVLLCLIALPYAFFYVASKGNLVVLLCGILIVAGLMWNLFFAPKQSRKLPYSLLLFLCFTIWIWNGSLVWIGVLYLITALLERRSHRPSKISFSQTGIDYSAMYSRHFDWVTLHNAVMKDGLLTLDFKDNRIIQKLISEENLKEAEFNHYCLMQIQAASKR